MLSRHAGFALASTCLAGVLATAGCGAEPQQGTTPQGSVVAQAGGVKVGTARPAGNAPAGNAQDWRQFRGPAGLGVNAAKLPVTWGPNDNIAWKVPLPGPGGSSPIVFGDRIYLTCWTGYNLDGRGGGSQENLKRHLLCLNKSNGQTIWSKEVAPKLPEQGSIRESHGYVSSTPVADAERIYVFFGKTGVLAFDHSGKQLWQTDVGDKLNGWGSAASPILYKDMVIVNASVESDSLVALDQKTGQERWRARGIREAWNTPVLVPTANGTTELIVPIVQKVLAFNPDNGQQIWTCDTGIGWYMVPGVVAAEGVIYCLGGRSGTVALAVRGGGNGNVTGSHRLWTGNKGSNVCSPIYHQGHLYWTNDAIPVAFCAEAATGRIVYEERIPNANQFYSAALLADDKIYYLARNGRTYVVAAKPQFELLATNDLGEQRTTFNSSPAAAGNKLLIRSDTFLYCIGK